MKKILLLGILGFSAFTLSGCGTSTTVNEWESDQAANIGIEVNVLTWEDKNNEVIDAQPEEEWWTFGPDTAYVGYEKYSLTRVQEEVDAWKDVILFVGASRCPPCIGLHKDIVELVETIPADMKIFTLDFDTMWDKLKDQLWVTKKHTTVYLNHDGSVNTLNISKEYSLDDILKEWSAMHPAGDH